MKNQLNWHVCLRPYPVFFEAALISSSHKLRPDTNDLNQDRENHKMNDFRLIFSHIEN